MKSYHVIGTMSGTSLDGLDMAYCEFYVEKGKWSFQLKKAETIPYSAEWRARLANLPKKSALDFSQTHSDYGHFIGEEVRKFIKKNSLNADFISSHGHTIFHQPEKGFTAQIGDGSAIAAETGLDVVCDFRSLDIALKGQGAPLVPIGDRFLFSEFDYRLNLGGFANISYEENEKTFAFDIAPANMGFNFFAQKLGYDYDKNGQIAESGSLIPALLRILNELDFYQIKGAKSLGREWFESEFLSSISDVYAIEDLLHTLVVHSSEQIAKIIIPPSGQKKKLLITGGGAYNTFLIKQLKEMTRAELVMPSPEIIDFKEALIFAFLGVLRIENNINTLKEVTGAKAHSIGGAVYKSL
ncbi:MAG: anhydro-N-acetylmuramic acid kinase [Bacteroidales bacterium]|nr:anhydro-N-acetylmuramic acid kinase [Bacteroidales bacterium]